MSADPFSRTIGFGGRCSCGAAMERTKDGTTFCQVCDNTPQPTESDDK